MKHDTTLGSLSARRIAWSKTPIAFAVTLTCSLAFGQAAIDTTSADTLGATSQFETGGQATIGPRPFSSFLERISSPVAKIELSVAGDNLAADGVSGTVVKLALRGKDGKLLSADAQVTIEVDGGARILLPGRMTSESGADRGDIDKIQPGVQTKVTAGALAFQLIAPFKPEAVTLRVTVNGVAEKVVVRYIADLRDMIAVGLIEGRFRANKFDPKSLTPAREDDGFDAEVTGFTKDFQGGKSQLGARAALYLKGKIRGDALLTVNYDSDKDTKRTLFNAVDPAAFYPVYGDASIRGADAQSAHKLYVRLDKGRNFLLLGDYTTTDANPARVLSQYSRSLPGVAGHYEEGRVTANAFVAQQSYRQIVDEFSGRGVSGPYSVSNPNGITNSEKVEIVIRSRFQTQQVIKVTPLARTSDYEFEPFSGQIVFRSPIPSFDDQLNPVSIRVTYEVEQGGQRFGVIGADVKLKVSDTLTIGVAAARDKNPAAPYDISGVNVALKLSKTTEVVAEVARSNSLVNTGANGFNTNNSANFLGKSGELSGQAARVELRHAGDDLRGRVYVAKAQPDFNNPASGITGGKTDVAASGSWSASKLVTLTGEVQRAEDSISGSLNRSGAIGADLKLSDRLTLGVGARTVHQNQLALAQSTSSGCSFGPPGLQAGNVAGYNTGFGISQVGNQQIDPATGQPVICNTAVNPQAATVPTSLDRSQGFLKLGWKATDSLSLEGELSRVTGDDPTNLYRLAGRLQATPQLGLTADFQRSFANSSQAQYKLGADWAVAEKTRLYGRYERSQQYAGVYGLGTGSLNSGYTFGVDSQYMQGGTVYSEYRLRDSESGRDIQSAIGLRNTWSTPIEGLKLLTNVERLNSTAGGASSAGLGAEYTGSPLWKGSGRVEWRHDAANTNWLFTASVARKLDRNWTFVGREYLNVVDPSTAGLSDNRQNRLQLGFAFRPVDNNQLDALGLYENKQERNLSGGIDRTVNIVTARANYHPNRAWWVSGRYAVKRVRELLEGTVNDSYTAQVLGGRVTYDITNRISVGAVSSVLLGSGGGHQNAYGLELGYVVVDNVWVTLGYNWRGYSDKDFASQDYTNRGWVLGVRYKFDEDVFKGDDPGTNKTLSPNASSSKPGSK